MGPRKTGVALVDGHRERGADIADGQDDRKREANRQAGYFFPSQHTRIDPRDVRLFGTADNTGTMGSADSRSRCCIGERELCGG